MQIREKPGIPTHSSLVYALWYVVLTLVVFCAVLAWLVQLRASDLRLAEELSGMQVSNRAAEQIEAYLRDLRTGVALYAEEHRQQIEAVGQAPSATQIRAHMDGLFRRRFEDYQDFRLADAAGQPLRETPGKELDPDCRKELAQFAAADRTLPVHLHITTDGGHILVMAKTATSESGYYILLMRFTPDGISRILANHTMEGHELYLVRTGPEQRVEIGVSSGVVAQVLIDEASQALPGRSVEDSLWRVIDRLKPDFIDAERRRALMEATLIFTGLILMTAGLLLLIRRSDRSRQRMELALRQQGGALRALVDGISDAVALRTPAGHYRMVNSAYARLKGRSAEELLNDESQLPDDGRKPLGDVLSSYDVMLSEETLPLESDERVYLVARKAHRDPSGSPTSLVEVYHDITERKFTEQALIALAESAGTFSGNDFFHVSVRNLAGAYHARYACASVLRDDASGHVTSLAFWRGEAFCHDAVCELHDTPCHEVICHGPRFIPTNLQEQYPRSALFRQLGVESFFGAPLVLPSGETVGVVCVMDTKPMVLRPWTEPVLGIFANRIALELEGRRTGRELSKSEARYRLLAENVSDMITVHDLDGAITYASPSCAHLTGYSADQLLGRTPRDFVLSRDWPTLEHYRSGSNSSEAVYTLSFRIRTANGEMRWLESSVRVVRGEGDQPSSIIAASRDVTARKDAERAARELEERERQRIMDLSHVSRLSIMGEMASGLAHELNQPLCAVSAYLQAMLRMPDSPQRMTDTLQKALHQSERASAIIHHLRDFVRKDTSRRVRVDINELCRDTIGFARAETKRFAANIRLVEGLDLPTVTVVAIQIEQVILNLLRNAMESLASVEGGIREVLLRTEAAPTGLRVTVQDAGPGLDDSVIGRVFEPFFTTKSSGLGMGLTISKSIIESHDGRMWAERPAEGGARFVFTLPSKRTTTVSEDT